MSKVTNVTYLVQQEELVKVTEFGKFVGYVTKAKNNWNLQTVYAASTKMIPVNGISLFGVGLGYYTEFEEARQAAIEGTIDEHNKYEDEIYKLRNFYVEHKKRNE